MSGSSRLVDAIFSTPAPSLGSPALSLHDALPIFVPVRNVGELYAREARDGGAPGARGDHHAIGGDVAAISLHRVDAAASPDRKSTRLNSSHVRISYAVFCLKKKTNAHPRRMCARH